MLQFFEEFKLTNIIVGPACQSFNNFLLKYRYIGLSINQKPVVWLVTWCSLADSHRLISCWSHWRLTYVAGIEREGEGGKERGKKEYFLVSLYNCMFLWFTVLWIAAIQFCFILDTHATNSCAKNQYKTAENPRTHQKTGQACLHALWWGCW